MQQPRPLYPSSESRLAQFLFRNHRDSRVYHRVKVIDLELTEKFATLTDLEGYDAVKAIVRLHGTPFAYLDVPVSDGRVPLKVLCDALENYHGEELAHVLLEMWLASPRQRTLTIDELGQDLPQPTRASSPLVTVAVCTRDRTEDLAQCLDALLQLDYPSLDLLVVDNAPSSEATADLVKSRYPCVRYVRELRPGLDWARNRAILEARGEILAYTDDDVIVDRAWVSAIADVFVEDPSVTAMLGLVVPYELETKAQILFERYGGFGRGFRRRWFRSVDGASIASIYGGTGWFGTGANMAFRRSVFTDIGLFDPALDVGTVTNGGGDLEMFFRVVKGGYTLCYEPRAMVRHRHRRDYERLREQIANNGVGLYSYFVAAAQAYPEERLAFLRLGLWWFQRWDLRRYVSSLLRPLGMPRDLIVAEFAGAFVGLRRYGQARARADEIAREHGSFDWPPAKRRSRPKTSPAIAVRSVDLAKPLEGINDVEEYSAVRVFVTFNDRPLGHVEIANQYQAVSTLRLRQAIAGAIGTKMLEPQRHLTTAAVWESARAVAVAKYVPKLNADDVHDRVTLPADVSASVVVATLDRPDDLRVCLRCLVQQVSPRRVEIVVIDNNPSSNLTPPVVAEFPGVVLVDEPRKGLAYARNKGFTTATGDILIATDDDVIHPPDWLEKLVAPFVRESVMIVTANVFPYELETEPQQYFENYGGLSRGFVRWEYDADWFDSHRRQPVPTWHLGATANAAFRATIFSNPSIGLMDEALGPGMPSGVGEDTYLFYKVLKSGYSVVYEPSAFVWHKHRRNIESFKRLIYNYSKGHIAYHLTTLLRDGDFRGLTRICYTLPYQDLWRIKERLMGRGLWPWSLIFWEIAGHLAGPWCLWRSRRRVKREGKSDAYVPVAQRVPSAG